MKRFFLFLPMIFFSVLVWQCSALQENPTQENHSPQITEFSISPAVIKINESSTVRCRAGDPDGDVLTYSWYSSLGTILGRDSVITWVAPEFQCQIFIRCTVSDGHGAWAADSALVTVQADTGAGG